ncbi:iron-sulfur cluster biosynthesis family protein [Lactobacillus juensis]|uniref:iron-sulfur cluster biosynthesis family protein n=1 Tax=Lactobacillus juensis TaxID=3082862 RepID=UPI0030C73078
MSNSESVKMNIKAGAADKIKKSVQDGQVVLLSLNDGSNKYSNIAGSCAAGTRFQFVVLDKQDPDFAIKVENNADLDLYTSPAEMQYLGNNLVVDEKNAAISLADDSGVIDAAMTVSENN